jgi:DNA-binding transcriptional regulator YiaG
MSPQEFRALRLELGFSKTQVARAFGLDPRTIFAWEAGTITIKPWARLALERLAQVSRNAA